MMNKTLSATLGVTWILAAIAVGCGAPPPPASPDAKPEEKASATAAGEKDSDGDGVPDSADKCPDKKEDGLGAEPKDGCPDTKPWARHPSPSP